MPCKAPYRRYSTGQDHFLGTRGDDCELFLGLLLLAATVTAFTALAIAGNLSGGPGYTASVLDHHIATLGPLAIFCAGLALALIFCRAWPP
ncbi:hypothetical protein [Streptomyces sp. NPDC002172]